jgi:hypothetical protein
MTPVDAKNASEPMTLAYAVARGVPCRRRISARPTTAQIHPGTYFPISPTKYVAYRRGASTRCPRNHRTRPHAHASHTIARAAVTSETANQTIDARAKLACTRDHSVATV